MAKIKHLAQTTTSSSHHVHGSIASIYRTSAIEHKSMFLHLQGNDLKKNAYFRKSFEESNF